MRRKTVLLAAPVLLIGCAGRPQPSPSIPRSIPEPAPAPVAQRAAPEPEPPPEVHQAPAAPSPVPEAPVSTPTVLELCEPVDSRRPYPTRSERKETIGLINRTCRAMGVGKEDCLFFSRIVSLRESSYRWWVRHKLNGDVSAAANSYLGTAGRYGWRVSWDRRDRKQERLEAIELTPIPGQEPNPYFVAVERWLTGGLGLGGLNVAYHLQKFDRTAPPEVLCDPVVNVMVQITIARNAVDRYGARNWYEVQAVYAGRTYYDERGRLRPLSCSLGCPSRLDPERRARIRKADAGLRKRCERVGLDCMKKPDLGTVLREKATPEDRYELADQVRGEPLPPFDEPEATVEVLLEDS